MAFENLGWASIPAALLILGSFAYIGREFGWRGVVGLGIFSAGLVVLLVCRYSDPPLDWAATMGLTIGTWIGLLRLLGDILTRTERATFSDRVRCERCRKGIKNGAFRCHHCGHEQEAPNSTIEAVKALTRSH
jgi:hypothetical protein